jgi:outer membrane lipoprotein SlyB
MLLMFAFTVAPIASAQTRRRPRRHRSFVKKHRDKLTVVGTTLGGAAIGGLAGGKKGALIGSAVGAGSGAVYTYKIRKRHRRPRRY